MGKEFMGVNRTTFLIDKAGKIVKIFYKVKPQGHNAEVLNYFLNNKQEKYVEEYSFYK